jgi:hypothetical protein
MTIRVTDFDIHLINTPLRFPFRYGIAQLSALPHAFVRVALEVDGKKGFGITADGLPPKWFTKNTEQTFRDELAEMFHVIETAGQIAIDAKPADSVFDLWQHIYITQMQWAGSEDYPPLLWNFGVSLIERAVIDAFCRLSEISFADALRSNAFGIRLNEIHQDLRDKQPADLLPTQPRRRVKMRQTLGLGDPICDGDIPESDRVHDGLPQSLEASIKTYGLSRYKVKLLGKAEVDLPRLEQLKTMLNRSAPDDYALTMDYNEMFDDAATFRNYWQEVCEQPSLGNLLDHMLVIEQPLRRDVALNMDTQQVLLDWSDRPPMVIDESDGLLHSLSEALESGYVGSTFKSCKGIFKGVANACLLEYLRRTDPTGQYIMTCEDLGILGPVSLAHDLAVIASLGFDHSERSGIHFFKGISHLPEDLQQCVLDSHSDLYHRHEDGFVAARVESGELVLDTTVDAPFGLGFEFDPSRFTPLDDWRFESLGMTS